MLINSVAPATGVGVKIFALAAGFLIVGVIYAYLRRKLKDRHAQRWLQRGITLVIIYYTALGFYARGGGFLQLSAFPPLILKVVIATLAIAIALLLLKPLAPLWNSVSLRAILVMQTFRFLAETLIFWLEREGAMPTVMTISGRNFDLLVPITALMLAVWLWRRDLTAGVRYALIIWNLLGIAVLTNTVVTAALSLPSNMQMFAQTQPLVAPAAFPFYLLPCLMVPLAFSLHILALLKLVGYYFSRTHVRA